MVNDLKTHQNVDNWKICWRHINGWSPYPEMRSRQSSLISKVLRYGPIITGWNLTQVSGKEMLMCFLRKRPEIQPLCVNGKVLETVKSHKVLGLIIQDNLKWNKHTEMSTSKASKRLHIIRMLRRGGVPPHDLLPHLLRSSSLCPRILLRYLA